MLFSVGLCVTRGDNWMVHLAGSEPCVRVEQSGLESCLTQNLECFSTEICASVGVTTS